ncbi:MAG TPA: hypothetical protein VKU79_03265 [Thermoplasmataceae archaeon]|nr:hypothetical protein [Thermoplasmatales archaeon AK]HLH85868.1 hypothetical protein [Thermoplasmataceae archaeon]
MKRVRPSELRVIVNKVAIEGRLPVMIWGAPGIGKSEIVRDCALEHDLSVLDLRLNYYEETDLLGIPMKTESGMRFLKYNRLPTKGNGIWFFDELTHARTQIQGLIFELINDCRIEDYEVPSGWRRFIGASNLPWHRSISNPMPAGLRNRFTGGHYELVPDLEDWVAWALSHDIDERLIAALQYLDRNDPKGWLFRSGNEGVELSPRIWATGVNYAMRSMNGPEALNAISGMIGDDNALEFMEVVKRISQLPDIDRILRGNSDWKPQGKDVSEIYLVVNGIIKRCLANSSMLPAGLKAASGFGNEYFYLLVSLLLRNFKREDVVKGLIDSGTYSIVEQML